MTYDKLRRILTRSGDENTTWTYSDTPGHLGELETVTTNNGTAQSYTYDALGRVTLQTETVSGQDFTKSYSYDSYGRVQTETWNTGFGIQNTYNQHGYLSSIKTSSNQLIWQPNAYNVRGQITDYVQGNNLQTTKVYQYGFQTGKFAYLQNQNIYSNNYTFDYAKGNLLSRTDYLPYYKSETFTYDNLNRLTSENIVNGPLYSTTFATNGNISHKDDIGYYDYGDAGPHAVTGLTSTTGTLLPANDQTVDYTAFNKVSHISQGNLDYFITYGPDRLRRKTQLNSGIGDDVLLTKYYAFGDYEKEITPTGTRHLHYISGGDGLAAIYVKYSNAPDSLYFITTDHLGSIVGAINSTTGTIYRQNFDAWGRKRNPVTWSYTNIPDFPFDRGYTGHEHLKWFGLINMNGRMYDAAICRFLSPDPFVQMPDYTQNFNRYSYALNNPLIYSDPSGEFIFSAIIPFGFLIDAACWGAVLGGTGYTASVAFSEGGLKNWDWGQFGKSVGIGAISGVATAGIGSTFSGLGNTGIVGEFARSYMHGFTQGTLSEITGGDFMSGFMSGGLGSLGGSAFQFLGGEFAQSAIGTTSFSAISGGVGAELSGGNFWQGAATGATIGMLNHGAQLVQNDITRRMGRYVNSREEGLNYIYNNSPNEGKEMGMIEYVTEKNKTNYFITPWNSNTPIDTYFDYSKMPKNFGSSISKIMYHTHLSSNGPSYADFYNNSMNRNWSRSFVLSRSSVWEVNRWHSPVPPLGVPTGKWLSPVNEWLKGNFINY